MIASQNPPSFSCVDRNEAQVSVMFVSQDLVRCLSNHCRFSFHDEPVFRFAPIRMRRKNESDIQILSSATRITMK